MALPLDKTMLIDYVVLVVQQKWLPCPYKIKTLQNFFPEPKDPVIWYMTHDIIFPTMWHFD